VFGGISGRTRTTLNMLHQGSSIPASAMGT
jgi:hypothetical protein